MIHLPITKRKLTRIVILLIVITSLVFGGYFYYQYQKIQNSSGNPAEKESQDLLAKVAHLYLIPTGEEPTIATVSDPLKLKDQSFFVQAQKGDKVLIFTDAKRAILYRPSINKIIEIAPINNTQNETQETEKSTGPLKDKTF